MKRVVLLIVGLAFAGSLAGCNTIKGVGSDISALGNGLSNASDRVSEGIKKKGEGEM